MKEKITLNKLLLFNLPKENLYMVHKTHDIGFEPIGGLKKDYITDEITEEWSDVLNAEVSNIKEKGAYGIEIELDGIDAQRVTDFCIEMDRVMFPPHERKFEQEI